MIEKKLEERGVACRLGSEWLTLGETFDTISISENWTEVNWAERRDETWPLYANDTFLCRGTSCNVNDWPVLVTVPKSNSTNSFCPRMMRMRAGGAPNVDLGYFDGILLAFSHLLPAHLHLI